MDAETIGHELAIGWMESVGHHPNIVHPAYEYIDVGVTESDGYIYATQNFC